MMKQKTFNRITGSLIIGVVVLGVTITLALLFLYMTK